MSNTYQKLVLLLIFIVWGGGFLGNHSFASAPSIRLIANPNTTEIRVGSDPIAITAKVAGKNLQYAWKLFGPGKIEGQGSAIFYIPPETIEGNLTEAMLTVSVTDTDGLVDMESVTFRIMSNNITPPSPTPTPTPVPQYLDILTLEEASKEELIQLQATLSQQYQQYENLKKKQQQGENVKKELFTTLTNLIENLEKVNTTIKVISSENPSRSFQQIISTLTSLLAQSEEIKNGRQPLSLEEFFTDLSKIIQITELYQQVLEKLDTLTPGTTFEVRMGTEKDRYEFGDPFELRFWASQDCYAVLIDISRSQLETTRMTFFLPNYQFPDNKIEGDVVYSTLYDFHLNITVGPPEGIDTIHMFCSTEKIDLFTADFTKEPFYTIEPYDEDRLKKLLESLERLKNYEWARSSVAVFIGSSGRSLSLDSPETSGKFFPPIGATGTTGKMP